MLAVIILAASILSLLNFKNFIMNILQLKKYNWLLGIILTVSIVPALAQEDSEKNEKSLPLEATREITIDTQEGTWLSLDISPDGQTLLFDLLGDLYTLPIGGGKATQLTSGLPMDTQGRFSPDGKSIVYISDEDGSNNVWTMDLETGDKSQVSKSKDEKFQSAEWSPEGDYLVTTKGTGVMKMHLYHKNGGAGIALATEPANMKDIEPTFGTDARYIWFSRRDGMWQYNAQMPQYQIYTYDRETGKVEPQTSRHGSAFSPTLSPDGQWLVFGTRYETETGLIARNLETNEEKWLAYPVQRDEQEAIAPMGVLPSMTFTPDSKYLIASYGGKIHKIAIDGSGAEEIPFEVNTTLKIGPKLEFKYPISDSKEMTVTQIRDAKVSPDGSKMVFVALDKLYLMNYPKGTPKRLTSSAMTEAQPSWSPDGKSIVYAAWSQPEGGALYKIATSGKGGAKKLTTSTGIYREPVFSPNGERIVFRKSLISGYVQKSGSGDAGFRSVLNWIPSNGGEQFVITSTEIGSTPHFTTDANRIFMYSVKDGLYSINWEGLDKRSHVKVDGIKTYNFEATVHSELPDFIDAFDFKKTDSPASLMVRSPKGDKALALVKNEVYVVSVPRSGGDTPKITVADVKSSSFPSWKLTEIGGEFPSWSADGTKVYWSLGHGFFEYDLSKAEEEGYEAEELSVEVKVERDIPEGTILLQGARIITMNGDEVIEKGDVLVVNNRIEAVGESGSLDVPGEAQVIDVSGKTITPGFVDTHAHLRPRWEIHTDQVWAYAANLAYGVTTTRDPQTSTTDVLSYADRVETGQVLGPRIYSTGSGVGYWGYNIQSLDHARKVLRQYSEYYDTKTIKMYMVGNRQQRQWIIMAAKEQELMPTTEGGLDFKLNITEILDGYPGHEHSYPVYPLYDDFLQAVSQSQIAYTSTLLVDYNGPWGENYYFETEDVLGDEKLAFYTPKADLDAKARRRTQWFAEEEYFFDDQAKFIDDLVQEGGITGVGSHGQLQGLGYHWELWSVQSGGMSNHNALKVATIIGAKALGLDQDLGSIEVGKVADLVVLEKNPLEDIRNSNTVKQVMINGRLYIDENLQQIAPDVSPAPEFHWHHEKPEGLPGIKN